MISTTIFWLVLLLSSPAWCAAASPSMPNIGAAAVSYHHKHPVVTGMEEAPLVPAAPTTTEPPFASTKLLRLLQQRDESLTYAANVCGFVSGSIDAAITCKVADRTCTPVGTWFRCCSGTATDECSNGAVPTACINYSDGGSTGCSGAGVSTTCCSESTRQFCESLVMTTAGSSIYNVVCGGRDRGTGLIPLLPTATDDPRLLTSSSSTTTSQASSGSYSPSSKSTGSTTLKSTTGDGSGTGEGVLQTDSPAGSKTTNGDDDDDNDDNDEKPVGAIVGGVVGGVAAVSLVLVAMWFLRRRNRGTGGDSNPASSISRRPSASPREMRGPSPVYLPPQTLPELPAEKPSTRHGSGSAAELSLGSSSNPMTQSSRYYYGGMPKAAGPDDWDYPGPPSRDAYGTGRRV